MDIDKLALQTFERHIQHNAYPGRGLVIGRASVEDSWLLVYWIMGRSASSRNRHFVVADKTVRTEPVDTSHMERPELLIYEAMLELPGLYLVSNGDQTRTLYETLRVGGTFDEALATREREHDVPHYTSRISGLLALRDALPEVTLSIVKANAVDPAYSDRITYRPAVPRAGLGVGLTTYMGDGNPLPSFVGDPLVLPLVGSAEEVLDTYWHALNGDNRISLAVKEISLEKATSRILVRNRFSQ